MSRIFVHALSEHKKDLKKKDSLYQMLRFTTTGANTNCCICIQKCKFKPIYSMYIYLFQTGREYIGASLQLSIFLLL